MIIIHSAQIFYIVANDNTQLLQYSVGHCNSRLDSCWCFCIFIAHNHRLNVATVANPKMAKTSFVQHNDPVGFHLSKP